MRVFVTLCALALAACNQGKGPEAPTEAAPKGPAPAVAQQARIVPKVGGAVHAPMAAGSQPIAAGSQPIAPGSMAAGSLPAGHPPVGDLPAGHPPLPADHAAPGSAAGSQPMAAGSQPVAPVAGGGSIKGTLDVSPALKAQIKAGTVLFVIVRQDLGEGQRGTLLAAKKVPITGPEMFPYVYEVGSADVMMQGSVLAGKVRVEARADSDGDALSKLAGDVTGGPRATEVGQEGVDFVLDAVLP